MQPSSEVSSQASSGTSTRSGTSSGLRSLLQKATGSRKGGRRDAESSSSTPPDATTTTAPSAALSKRRQQVYQAQRHVPTHANAHSTDWTPLAHKPIGDIVIANKSISSPWRKRSHASGSWMLLSTARETCWPYRTMPSGTTLLRNPMLVCQTPDFNKKPPPTYPPSMPREAL